MKKVIVACVVVLTLVLSQVTPVYAWPSSEFYCLDDEIYDEWGVCRTTNMGERGFFQEFVTEVGLVWRPLIAFQSLGEYVDTAYELGQQFAEEYPDRVQRAEQVFYFVRDGIQYTPKQELYGMPEFAKNADEIVNRIDSDGIAYGDCVEYAILLAVMYQGAGYRSAIVLSPGHAAAMLFLPGYQRANVVFIVNGEPGWIWLEATGSTNRFGWFPLGQIDIGQISGYELSHEHLPHQPPPGGAVRCLEEPPPPSGIRGIIIPIVIVSALIGLVILLGRKLARRRG